MAGVDNPGTLQELVSTLPFPLWLADRGGRLVAVSEQLSAICLPADHLSELLVPGDTWPSLVSRADQESAGQCRARAAIRERGRQREVEVNVSASAGDGLYLGWISTAVGDDADREWLVNQVAHALRNPIFAALVQTETISMRAAEDPRLTKAAGMLYRQLKRLEAHLNEMLLYGRAAPVQVARVHVARLLDAVAERYRRGQCGEPAEVTVRVADPQLEVTWDPKAVEIILERLLDNAVQHSEPPHHVEISATVDDNQVVITVRDQGEGIPESMIDQVMLPFYPQHRGRPGLGLAIALKFATALGGSLHISSVPERGTEVRCSLPLVVAE